MNSRYYFFDGHEVLYSQYQPRKFDKSWLIMYYKNNPTKLENHDILYDIYNKLWKEYYAAKI